MASSLTLMNQSLHRVSGPVSPSSMYQKEILRKHGYMATEVVLTRSLGQKFGEGEGSVMLRAAKASAEPPSVVRQQ